MQGFDIETERVTAAGAEVTELGGRLGTEIAVMQRLLGEVRGAWQSTHAAPRFAAVMQDHLQQVSLMRQALLGHGTALQQTGRRIDAAELDLAAALGSGR